LDDATFEAFTHSLAHRGPDGFGIEHDVEARLRLGHRRLAILDLSELGHQPLSYANGRFWITFNGEVYNFLELREELGALGHRFVSNTDTEVVAAAYAQWGSDCLLRFNGMWALAIWDRRERQLFLSRDRFGVKPLHYSLYKGAIAFASELKAFLALPWVDGSLDPELLSETLTNLQGHESTSYTLLPQVRRLQAGHSMLVHANGHIRITRWWNTLNHLPSAPAGLREQADQFGELFFDACRVRLRSDVPVVTSLSGGLDSSAIACTLAELHRRGQIAKAEEEWDRAFVVSWKDTRYDEEAYARTIIQHTGMQPHYEAIDEVKALEQIEKIIFEVESLFQDPKVGHWMIYRAMRNNGYYVSLDGCGADELLGGYPTLVEAALDSATDLFRYFEVSRILRGFDEAERVYISSGIARLFKHEMKRLRLLEPLAGVRARLRTIAEQLWLLKGGSQVGAQTELVLRAYRGPKRLYNAKMDADTFGMAPLQATLYSWFHGGMLPTLLRNFDRAAMAHGVETRMPFMDWRLVTYGFALPETSKIGAGFTKLVLRMAMAGLMPESIRLRTNKFGFVSPVNEWTRGPFHAWAQDVSASQSFLENSVWNGRAVKAMIERASTARQTIEPVWPILQAHLLERLFKSKANSYKTAKAKSPHRAASPADVTASNTF
jgi:asparagine synthase (glutamine-hydrolysing)